MSYLWKIVRPLMAIVGGILVFGAIGTSDYYLIELGQSEPSYVMTTILVGVVMMLPTLIHAIREEVRG